MRELLTEKQSEGRINHLFGKRRTNPGSEYKNPEGGKPSGTIGGANKK